MPSQALNRLDQPLLIGPLAVVLEMDCRGVTHERCQIPHQKAPVVGLVPAPGVTVPEAVRGQAWIGGSQALPVGVALQQLPEGLADGLEVAPLDGGQDAWRQLDQLAVEQLEDAGAFAIAAWDVEGQRQPFGLWPFH